MAGHSKWANIASKKARIDSRRGKIFSVISKEITVAARSGGGDPSFNIRLRTLVDKAKFYNMPADNVTRAIKKGTGEIPGIVYEEIVYEGYGPSGVGIIVEVMTDNKNRSAGEVRAAFTKHGGNMAGAGAVAFNFHRKGHIIVARETIAEDALMDLVLNAGAEDMQSFESHYEVLTNPHDFDKVVEALGKAKIATEESEVAFLGTVTMPLGAEDVEKLNKLMAAIEEIDDVQHVWSNVEEE